MSKRSFNIPGFKENAVLQLVVATSVGFILYNFTRVTLIVFGRSWAQSFLDVAPNVALPALSEFRAPPWTLLTYGWVHPGFMMWLSNAIWLYTFGSVVQMLVGYRQVIPVFVYGLIGGGIICLLAQLAPGALLHPPGLLLMTSQAGVMALMGGALTLAPRYRYYLGERFSIPIWIVVAIYMLLNVATYAAGNLPMLILGLGGAGVGSLTMLLLKRGYQPGRWMYSLSDSVQGWGTPDEDKLRRAGSTRRRQVLNAGAAGGGRQQRIDAILDKINQRGYGSLTREERDILQRESNQ